MPPLTACSSRGVRSRMSFPCFRNYGGYGRSALFRARVTLFVARCLTERCLELCEDSFLRFGLETKWTIAPAGAYCAGHSQGGHSGGVEMKGDKDWQRVPGILTDRLVVKVSPRAVRIVFGQVGETEVSFHTAVVMTRRNAAALAEAIQKLSAKSKGPDVRKATVSGGQVH